MDLGPTPQRAAEAAGLFPVGEVAVLPGAAHISWLDDPFAAALCCAYLWEICDALGTEHWRRRITPTTRLEVPDSELRMISLHVPAHNEPPDMVIDTLRSLLRLDYPRYEIILIDDNTDDEQLWRPVEAWCERDDVKFAHLENWPGYKSGALNYALRRLTSLRRGTGASWRDALGAFFIWQSTSLVVARASVLALFAKKAAFLRTPKTSERTRWWEALRTNWAESTLALFGFLGIVGALTKANQLSGPLLAVLLLFPTLGMAAAPVNSWAARRAALPADLRERRSTEYRRDRHSFAAGVATGGAVAVLGVAIAALALLFTGNHTVQPPNLVGPAQGTSSSAAPTHSPSPSPSATTSTPTPTPSPSTTPTPSPSATPTPTPTPTPTATPTPSTTPTPTTSPTP